MHLPGIDRGLDQEFLRLGQRRAQLDVLRCERRDRWLCRRPNADEPILDFSADYLWPTRHHSITLS